MKATILVRGYEVRVCDGNNPEYEFFRRIEKEGFEAEEVYRAERVDPETVRQWLAKRFERDQRLAREEQERAERETLERLKRKYEGEKP